jgi:hypothetical protein
MDKKIRVEDLRGPELSYMVFKKADLVEILGGYPGVTQEQAQQIWSWYSGNMGKIYDQARVNSASVSAEFVKAMGFSHDGWVSFAHSIGLDHDTTIGIYGDHTARAEQVGAEMAERAAEAEAEAESAAEAEAEQAENGALPKEQAQLLLRKILADPNHPYNDDKATPADHDLAVAGVNRLYAIIAGLETKIEGYAEEHLAQKEQEMKEAYGVQGGSVFKTGDFKSSNNIPADQSWKESAKAGGKDDLANSSGDAEGEGA